MTNLELWNTVAIATTSLLAALLIYVWTAIALGAVFRKSGEPAWKGWVPILNIVVLLRLGGLSGWLVLLFIIPIAGWIALLIAVHRINVSFGYGGGMTVLAFFLFPVWASVVGFGPERWVGREVPPHPGPVRSTMAAVAETPSERSSAATAYSPIAPPPAYGRAVAQPPAPPAAARGGWTPPPLPSQPVTSAPGPAASAPLPSTGGAPRSAPVDSVPKAGAVPTGRAQAPAAAPTGPVTPAAPAASPATAATQAASAGPEAPAAPAGPATPTAQPAPAVPPAPAAASRPIPSRTSEVPIAEPTPAPSPSTAPASDAPAPAPAAPSRDIIPELDEYPAPAVIRRTRTPLEPLEDAPDDDEEWSFDVAPGSATSEVTGAVTGAPAPVSAAPARSRPAGEGLDPSDSEGALPPVTRVPAASDQVAREPWAPSHSPLPSEGEAFPESSGPVSAIAGAPDAGGPRSALASVSALHTQPHIPEDDDDLDETIVARRNRTPWVLVGPARARIPLTSETVILGRRPARDPEFPDAQLISLDDDTRTISKTHARLELRGERWFITDLDSTNGVLFATLMGTEVAATPGEATEAGDRFLLGDAEVSLVRSDE
jgi:hypothetical protein